MILHIAVGYKWLNGERGGGGGIKENKFVFVADVHNQKCFNSLLPSKMLQDDVSLFALPAWIRS